MMELFQKVDLAKIQWSQYRNGAEVSGYFEEMMEHGAQVYIKNVDVEFYLLAVDDLLLPLTKTNGNPFNSYVVSPFSHYVSYAIEELRELQQPLLEHCLKSVLQCLGLFLKWGKIDKVVMVNNWLLSTNLYEMITEQQVKEMTLFLQKRFPQETIMFRSLASSLHPRLISSLHEQQAIFVPSRSIYLFYPEKFSQISKKKRKTIRRDQRFLQKSGYWVDDKVSPIEMERVLELYNQLYLKKYSYFNPQFTLKYLQNAYERHLLGFRTLKKGNRIDGVVGFITCNGVMTTPLLGYDTTMSRKVGLYRLCSMIQTEQSLQTGLLLHRSAGAGNFKRNRGAVNEVEYSSIIVSHLPIGRRIAWKTLAFLLNRIGVPLLKKFEL
ncbi:hypothetical protein ACA29_04310 [Lederbergia galactosidilytica]|uniref:BioF2-like acetyltransferase domain-containing protein n=1 Tax=Lederbergia galactosidilytica TaxID=217031 RepID=A0A0Q9Y7A3_9BACI|nr:hypothetical protein ACA29_04310 [Lederbergia galactosidilytica]